MTPEENKSVVQEFYDQWNSGAIDFERLVHPNITNHQPDRDPEVGLDKFRQAIEGVMGAVPDSKWTTVRLIAEGDLVVSQHVERLIPRHDVPGTGYCGRQALLRGAHPRLPPERWSDRGALGSARRPRNDAADGRDHLAVT